MMKIINKIFFFTLLCPCLLFSNAYSQENELAFRLVHPDNDKIVYASKSQANVNKSQYELFTKGKENYWVDRKVELNIKDFKDAEIKIMTMDSSKKVKWETIDTGSSIPPDAACTVVLYFSENGQKKIEKLTERNIRRRLAIIYNNNLLMAPIIQEKIIGETISLAGVSYNEAQGLKLMIKK